MYTGIRLLLLICPFIFSFFFLSNFQTFNFLSHFSQELRPRRLKLCTHMDSGWIYRVYQNEAAAAYLSLYFSFSNFQTLKIFVTLFSATMTPRRLKHGTHVDNGWIYRVYRNRAAAAYSSICFSYSFSPIFKH